MGQCQFESLKDSRVVPMYVPDRWCVHSYYTLCPYAPDNSGRLLLAGADLDRLVGEVLILSPEGEVLDRFGENRVQSGFFHTGFWQTWSPDARFVYYQSGDMKNPKIVRRELATGTEIMMEGDMEGAGPTGEPIISGLMGMLYAAGYGKGIYYADQAPVPFQKREQHGIFMFSFEPVQRKLCLSVEEMLQRHPLRDKLLQAEKELQKQLGDQEGLTLMTYCVRWNPTGSRLLFYFGNHCVDKSRGEPRLAYIFTTDRNFEELHLAVDLSFGRPGVHWSWHPDGERLIGYGPDPENNSKMCLTQVGYDGSNYRKISRHASGGHPSISPVNHNLLVTDTYGRPGEVVLIDLRKDEVVQQHCVPNSFGDSISGGRNPYRVCHHPVFSRDGRKVLINTLPGRNSVVCEIQVPEGCR